jgi:deoxycytidine triphosphate deaminase
VEYKGIIIAGTSGVRKSSIARSLCEEYEIFQMAHAVTTREHRKDDIPGQYQYINGEGFEGLESASKLLVKAKYRGEHYGITYEALQEVRDNNRTPILILSPESVGELEAKGNKEGYAFLTVFLDASDDVLDYQLRQRGDRVDKSIREQREEDRKYAENCIYAINTSDADVEDIVHLMYYLWSYRNVGGVLPSKLIKLMIKCGMLLENADLNNVEGASYDLVLGDEYYHKGKIQALDEKAAFILMEPGDYVLASSKEIANFPKDIAGRFDLCVSLFCEGVILSNGPQVDPGFRGRLFCFLFNTSNEKVQLKRGEHFTTIEFLKLIEPTIPYKGRHQNKVSIAAYLPKVVEASAINELIDDVEDLKEEKWWIRILPLVLSAISIIAAIYQLLSQ